MERRTRFKGYIEPDPGLPDCMGADGGSIAKRSELIKTAENPAACLPIDNKNSLWTLCSLSHQRLQDPVVSDYNGSLYNKTAILELLIGTYHGPKPTNHRVTQIRDVVELQRDVVDGRWIDTISRKDLELEGSSERFAYLAQCGHIAPLAVLLEGSNCPICEAGYDDMVILNPQTAESRQRNQTRMDKLNQIGLSNSLRPSKRSHMRKRNRTEAGNEDGDSNKHRRVP